MKSAIATLLISAGLVTLLYWYFAVHFDPVRPNIENFSNALFFIGLPLFFFGLISITGANRIFIAMGYTFKNIFRRHRVTYSSYHEYITSKQAEKESQDTEFSGGAALIIGILYLATAFIIII